MFDDDLKYHIQVGPALSDEDSADISHDQRVAADTGNYLTDSQEDLASRTV